uniref:Uncharacterized protein n=1 Tax=Meloidogyne javanica TaxID=6303 RepID=A0A915N3E5_MELJA
MKFLNLIIQLEGFSAKAGKVPDTLRSTNTVKDDPNVVNSRTGVAVPESESSSMPNLQNNPNEIENEDQKYLLVTQEMINQREKGQSFLELNGIGIPDGIWRYYTGYLKAGIGMPITVGY